MQDFRLKVEYGSLYTSSGSILEKPAIIYDIDDGLMKYGEAEKLQRHYDDTIKRYSDNGYYDMVDCLKYAEFDRYDGILDIEEICTLLNYMILCSANGERIHNILNMDEDSLKKEIEKLSSVGY